MPFQAKVILDSIGPQGNRLTTMEFTIPKLWLAEFNTHCMFARNSASTRAIPFQKQVAMMTEDMFIPEVWPLENPGMSAKHNASGAEISILRDIWCEAAGASLEKAEELANIGIHKQLAGRLLEPWRFQTVLVTGDAGSYANFFHQRRDRGAAPEIRRSADFMWEAYLSSRPLELKAGRWHMPLIIKQDMIHLWHPLGNLSEGLVNFRKISAARCARLSYLTHHGIRDQSEDLKLFDKLVTGGHWSPLEHVCRALPVEPFFKRWFCKRLKLVPSGHGKWAGWHQLRKDFGNEYVREYKGEL